MIPIGRRGTRTMAPIRSTNLKRENRSSDEATRRVEALGGRLRTRGNSTHRPPNPAGRRSQPQKGSRQRGRKPDKGGPGLGGRPDTTGKRYARGASRAPGSKPGSPCQHIPTGPAKPLGLPLPPRGRAEDRVCARLEVPNGPREGECRGTRPSAAPGENGAHRVDSGLGSLASSAALRWTILSQEHDRPSVRQTQVL